jgi:glucose-1-phosphate cytidylyltransferase
MLPRIAAIIRGSAMKVVLFCGGQGMRIREVSDSIPKPMVPLRGRPILWHIMKYYAYYKHTDFVVCLGYKGEKIRAFFEAQRRITDGWNVQCVETGMNATIGDRLLAVKEFVKDDPMFLANYGDGVSDLPLDDVIALNQRQNSVCTFVSVRPHVSYHFIKRSPDGFVTDIKPTMDGFINGGFFVMRPEIFDVLNPGEEIVVEAFNRLIPQRKLTTYEYRGFWQSCDTFKDLMNLEKLCVSGPAPWEIWSGSNSLHRAPVARDGSPSARQERSSALAAPGDDSPG